MILWFLWLLFSVSHIISLMKSSVLLLLIFGLEFSILPFIFFIHWEDTGAGGNDLWCFSPLLSSVFFFSLKLYFASEGLGFPSGSWTSASAQKGRLKSATISSPEGNLELNTLRYGKYFCFPGVSADLRSAGIPSLALLKHCCHSEDDFHHSLQGLCMSWDCQGCASPSGKCIKILVLGKPCAGWCLFERLQGGSVLVAPLRTKPELAKLPRSHLSVVARIVDIGKTLVGHWNREWRHSQGWQSSRSAWTMLRHRVGLLGWACGAGSCTWSLWVPS